MKLAIYKNTEYDYESVREVDDYFENDENSIRLSEQVDVDFKMLDKQETVKQEVMLLIVKLKSYRRQPASS